MKISFVIASFNRQQYLCDTIEDALAQTHDDLEVVVVDQTPAVAECLQQLIDRGDPRLRYLRLERPSVTRARNLGVRSAAGDIVIFVDDDVKFGPELAAGHLRHYADGSIGGVTGLIVEGEHGSIDAAVRSLREDHESPGLELGSIGEITWMATGNASYRKTALLKAQLFDENLPGNFVEDLDLSIRVKAAGYRLIADTSTRLIHLGAREGGNDFRNVGRSEEKALEVFRSACYCCLKNVRLTGWRIAGRMVFRAYRQYAMNRETLQKGIVLQRHWKAFVEMPRVFSALRRLANG